MYGLKDVRNPWKKISWTNTIEANDEKYFIKNFTSPSAFIKSLPTSVGLTFDALPEPFSGDVNSKVYCLNMNHGWPDSDFNKSNDTTLVFEKQIQSVLNHSTKEHLFAGLLYDGKEIINDHRQWEKQLAFVGTKNIVLPRPHFGSVWQRQIMNPLRKLLGRDPNVFFIEYFPYHSKYGFKFPNELPSYEYRNYLVRKALFENKLIIIMRMENLWYDAIPELKFYPNKLFLKSKRCVWLSLNNFCRDIPVFRSCGLCQTKKEILDMF